MKLYMIVTADEYELPIFIGNSSQVAEKLGISVTTVYTMAYLGKSGTKTGRKVVKVDIEE